MSFGRVERNMDNFAAPKLGIVLVPYNSPEHMERCLQSIRDSSYQNVEIIVIDNSTIHDGSEHPPAEKNFHYQKTGDNIGFCAACNLGIAESLRLAADYTLILNFDTVLEADALEKLVARAEALANPGIVCGKIFYLSDPGRIWYAGGRLSLVLGVGKHCGFNEKDSGRYDVSQSVTYATGCCMLVPTRVFSRVGGFKEELFMYLDDAEFCLRVLKAGLSIHYEPSAVLYHAVGPGAEKSAYSDYYLYFSIRNKPYISSSRAYRAYLRAVTLALAVSKLGYYGLTPGIKGRAEKLKAIALGYWDSFSLKPKYRERFPRLFERRETREPPMDGRRA